MAELYPLAMGHHLRRILHELRTQQQIYDLPVSRFYVGQPELDTSVTFHDLPASTALGPAAGPQDQLIQNVVLSWLGGSRIIELKTVQILDELKIPRPCIEATNIGFNVEWSQELKLEKSLREYVASSMILEILRELDVLGLGDRKAAKTHTVLDMSVGYDLAGISTERVTGWIRSMMDATRVIDELRAEIPDELKQFRDFDFNKRIANSITLSTFHGCPPAEIERICHYLLTEIGTHTIIKLNPTQLGKERLEHLLHDVMGYSHLEVNQKAYAAGLSLDEAIDIVNRLEPEARKRNLGLGVKFSNTLETVNRREYFKDEIMYMSGPPLHVIAMNLVGEWRQKLGTRYPISFSAGIDADNFYKAVALGLTPITTCTDLLKPRGYGRQVIYLKNLEEKMTAAGAHNIPEYIVRARGNGEKAVRAALAAAGLSNESRSLLEGQLIEEISKPRGDVLSAIERYRQTLNGSAGEGIDGLHRAIVDEAARLNTFDYVAEVTADGRYHHAKNKAVPKKIGSYLYLFDCISCDKCVPVCPNDANFIYEVHPVNVTYRNLRLAPEGVLPDEEHIFHVNRAHQIANYADFCNECGNCDTFCPEYGGPYIMKPRFFGTTETYALHADHDGFVVERAGDVDTIRGRILGHEYWLRSAGTLDTFSDGVLEVDVENDKVKATRVLQPERLGHITDLKNYYQLRLLLRGVLSGAVNYVNIVHAPPVPAPLP
jgi:putative selenate reductase